MMKVALPIETKVRELDEKLWLALNLVNKGFKIALGEMGVINNWIDWLEPDVYFGDSAVYREAREALYRKLNRVDVKIIVLDTEGAVFRSSDAYTQRLSPKILQYVDCFLAWGSKPADILQNFTDFPSENIAITGNPRFDLLNKHFHDFYREESNKIKSKFGRYVLINTNFTEVNHFSEEILERSRLSKDPQPQLVSYQKKIFEHFIKAITCISTQFPEINVVVRPHPSENHDRYREIFANYKNIYVEHWWDVRTWILGAVAVIHNSCTTGIESALMEKPVFAFCPVKNPEYDLFLPNFVSKKIDTSESLCNEIGKCIENEKKSSQILTLEKKSELKKYIYNIDGLAAKRITDLIDSMEYSGTNELKDVFRLSLKQRTKKGLIRLFGEAGFQKLNKLRKFGRDAASSRNVSSSYRRQKFPGLTKEEIKDKISKFSKIGVIKLNNIHIEPISVLIKNAFWIYKVRSV